MVAGLTVGRTRIDGVSVNTNPDNLINANGLITGQLGDRPYIFKWTGTYVCRSRKSGSANYISEQSGIAVTWPGVAAPDGRRDDNINVEAPGSHRLDPRNQLDLRLAKSVKMGANRSVRGVGRHLQPHELERRRDVRTLSGTIGLRQNGDLNGTSTPCRSSCRPLPFSRRGSLV